MAGVRKTVTAVFCDVTGSTLLGERLDPETLRRLMESYFASVSEALGPARWDCGEVRR